MAKRLQYRRLLLLAVLLGAAFAGLGYRLVDLQVLRHDELRAKAAQNTEREIFLRELISNASDALTRVDFETLTNRDILDPDAELAITITADPEQNTLTISDTGIGMTAEEMAENLGTIAHSGAKAFVTAAKKGAKNLSDVIGQFGVGFYSAFMVAEWIRVVSRT